MNEATRYELVGGVATVTLDRPDSRNALSVELMDSLGENLERAVADPQVRVIVLTNEGPAFCAGADLKAADWSLGPVHDLSSILGLLLDSPKPTLARVAGHAMGGGVGLAAACDLSVASDDSLFGFTEVRRGVAPAVISVVCLSKLRRADASELFLTGRRISASRAVEVGLLNAAVPPGELDARVASLVAELLAGGPNALAACKQLISRVPSMSRSYAFAWTSQVSASLFRSEEAAEGISAFRDKIAPPWARE